MDVITLDPSAAEMDAWTPPATIEDPQVYAAHAAKKVSARFIGRPLLENLAALIRCRVSSYSYGRSFTCLAGLNVGDPVYCDSANSVLLATAAAAASARLFGFVRYKPASTSCYVEHYRYASGLSALTAGATVYLTDAGGFAAAAGTVRVTAGIALSTTTAMLSAGPLVELTQPPAAASVPNSVPRWRKYTKGFGDLAKNATSNDIELVELPAAAVIHAVKIKHSAAFTGGIISAYTLSVGIAGVLAKYAPAFDVFQAPGNAVQQLTEIAGTENHAAVTSLRLAAVCVGADLDAATAGAVDVWVLWSLAE